MFPDGTKFYSDIKDGVRGYNTDAARGADTFVPFSRSDFIAIAKPIVIDNTPITAFKFDNYNDDIITYNADTGEMVFSKTCKVVVCVSHAPIGANPIAVVSYQKNNDAITPLITTVWGLDLQTSTVTVNKGDHLIMYYNSNGSGRRVIVAELHASL